MDSGDVETGPTQESTQPSILANSGKAGSELLLVAHRCTLLGQTKLRTRRETQSGPEGRETGACRRFRGGAGRGHAPGALPVPVRHVGPGRRGVRASPGLFPSGTTEAGGPARRKLAALDCPHFPPVLAAGL